MRLDNYKQAKFFLVSFIFLTFLSRINAEYEKVSHNFNWSGYKIEQIAQLQQSKTNEKRLSEVLYLQLGKNYLLNGDLPLAKFHLSKISNSNAYLHPVRKRLMAVIYFIEGNYEQSLQELKFPLFQTLESNQMLCSLKMANYLALNLEALFTKEQSQCEFLNSRFNKHKQMWNSTLARIQSDQDNILSKKGINYLKRAFGSTEYITSWMKLALFTNQEEAIIKSISELSPETYQSKNVRELIGFAHYRKNNKSEALSFIEDIDTPNADNIRGNLMLKERKLELAFGHFQLALKKRPNSLNAIERSIPISWKLGQWEKGLRYVKRLYRKKIDKNKKLTLKAAFQIQNDKFKEASRSLTHLNKVYQLSAPLKLILMNKYLSLRNHDNESLIEFSRKGCEQNDGTSCWIYQQALRWENLGQTIDRDDEVLTQKLNIDDLKKPIPLKPLTETVLIDQSDIEELDYQFQ